VSAAARAAYALAIAAPSALDAYRTARSMHRLGAYDAAVAYANAYDAALDAYDDAALDAKRAASAKPAP